MARAILDLASSQHQEDTHRDIISGMIQRFTQGMPTLPESGKPLPERNVVLLTGSTGYLGSHMLTYLLRAKRVKHVYALNRPSQPGKNSLSRHESALDDR
jgi:hypothetical protein